MFSSILLVLLSSSLAILAVLASATPLASNLTDFVDAEYIFTLYSESESFNNKYLACPLLNNHTQFPDQLSYARGLAAESSPHYINFYTNTHSPNSRYIVCSDNSTVIEEDDERPTYTYMLQGYVSNITYNAKNDWNVMPFQFQSQLPTNYEESLFGIDKNQQLRLLTQEGEIEPGDWYGCTTIADFGSSMVRKGLNWVRSTPQPIGCEKVTVEVKWTTYHHHHHHNVL